MSPAAVQLTVQPFWVRKCVLRSRDTGAFLNK